MNPRCRKTWGDPEWDGHRTCRLRRVPCKDGPGRGEGVGDGERAGFAAHAGTILTDVPRTGRLSELNAAGVRSLARHPFSCQAKAQRTDRSWPHAAVRSPGRSPEFRRSLPRETGNHECKPIRQRHLRIHQQMDGPIFALPTGWRPVRDRASGRSSRVILSACRRSSRRPRKRFQEPLTPRFCLP